MWSILRVIAIVFVFAWAAKAILGARELNWVRTLAASVIGFLIGVFMSVAVLARNVEEIADIDGAELLGVTLPIALIATMGVLVMMEALFMSRTDHRSSFSWVHPFRSIGHWWGTLMRGREVSAIVVRNGLGRLVGLRHGEDSPRNSREIARRLRMTLEQAGGMFVKLGQLLATRPDLLPPEALEELEKLQGDVAPLPADIVRAVVERETGRSLEETFESFDWEPLGSASIGQAHVARLVGGDEVVVKVQRPGLESQVDRDLAIVAWLAGIAERRTGWGRSYGVSGLVQGFGDALREELDFTKEASHATEMKQAVSEYGSIVVPSIYSELTSPRMLVMEKLSGAPVSKLPSDRPDLRGLADDLCRSQVTAMLEGRRFHGDPHQGNVMLLEDGRLGLVDFGITDRLDAFERSAVFEMLVALKLEDPAVLYDGLRTIGAVDAGHDPETVERALAGFLAEHMAAGQPSPEALTDLLRLTGRMGLKMPSSTTTMFRALATLSGTLESLSPEYPLLEAVAEIGGAELRERAQPESIGEYMQQQWAELGPLVKRAPRHLDRIATLLEHGGISGRLRLFAHPDEVRIIERLMNRAITSFLAIGLGIVSVLLLGAEGGPLFIGTDTTLLDIMGWVGLGFSSILLLRVLLQVFRTDGLSEH